MATCDRCGAPITWALTEHGRRICLDIDPHPNGNVVVASVDRYSVSTVHVLDKHEYPVDPRQRLLAHIVTCGGKPRPPVTALPPPPPFQDVLVLD